jgi:hypothetical protein
MCAGALPAKTKDYWDEALRKVTCLDCGGQFNDLDALPSAQSGPDGQSSPSSQPPPAQLAMPVPPSAPTSGGAPPPRMSTNGVITSARRSLISASLGCQE